jgi:hypothetical protein
MLQADIYRTDTADLGGNVSAFWIVNYTSGKHTNGVGVHNKTVFWNLSTTGTAAAAEMNTIAATAPSIPESNYFLNAVGTRYEYISSSTGSPAGVSLLTERLAAEGGVKWEPAYIDIGETDPEVGLHTCYSQVRDLFYRWPGDADPDRIGFQTARRWRTMLANNCTAFDNLELLFTYHAITYTVADSISGFSGTAYLDLCRTLTDEMVLSTTRSGDGSFSFTWYDNTEYLFISVSDASNVVGRSQDSLAV